MKDYGEELKEARLAKALTREELSGLCGISTATVPACERGRYIPSISTLSAMAALLTFSFSSSNCWKLAALIY